MAKLETFLIALVLCAPITAIIVISLYPFWEWFEATTGIESVGHFGIAVWCFIAVYIILMGGFSLQQRFVTKRPRKKF